MDPMTTFIIDRPHQPRNAVELTYDARGWVNTNATSGLVLHLAADRDDMRCARPAERLLHTLKWVSLF